MALRILLRGLPIASTKAGSLQEVSLSHRTRMWRQRHFATHFVNPVTRLFAGRAPGFGILTYRGRTSGRMYNTPVNVFRRDGDYIFVVTYGI